MKVAALYVQRGGCYWDLPDVEPWDEVRDARKYAGPWPVVAHPPCQRWGRYWSGGPNPAAPRLRKGDDGGCFEAALAAVRTWGGVLEHPEASHAWRAFHIVAPPRWGGWVPAGLLHSRAWTCCVEQGHYGHKSRKATWLYFMGPRPPELIWGKSWAGYRLDQGVHSKKERRRIQRLGVLRAPGALRLSKEECAATPLPFRDLLLSMARSVRPELLGERSGPPAPALAGRVLTAQ